MSFFMWFTRNRKNKSYGNKISNLYLNKLLIFYNFAHYKPNPLKSCN